MIDMKEKPGAQTPWSRVNQLLTSDERFEVDSPHWKGFLLAPKQSSQLAALLYFLNQANIAFCVQGRGHDSLPSSEHTVIISARSFSQMAWHEHGVVEVGAGCPLSLLHQFLFERSQEIALEEDPVASPKRSIAGIILSDRMAGLRYREEPFSEVLLGIELVTWEGSQIKWGGIYSGSAPGPTLHKLLWGLKTLPGIVIKVILKTYPIPAKRLRLAWTFQQQEVLWQQFYALKQFSHSWEYLDVVLSGQPSSQGFIFAQISGLPEEMEAFSHACPRYAMASHQGERVNMKQFFLQQKLKAHSVAKDYPLKREDYLWLPEWNQNGWLLTNQSNERENQIPIWKQRFGESFNLIKK
jgi:hypothetical protein